MSCLVPRILRFLSRFMGKFVDLSIDLYNIFLVLCISEVCVSSLLLLKLNCPCF